MKIGNYNQIIIFVTNVLQHREENELINIEVKTAFISHFSTAAINRAFTSTAFHLSDRASVKTQNEIS